MSELVPAQWEVWHARFDFDNNRGYKYRPVIIVGAYLDGSYAMMVTSATNKLRLPHDYLIQEWEAAGLNKPSIARVDRIAIIPHDYLGITEKIGELQQVDIDAITNTINTREAELEI